MVYVFDLDGTICTNTNGDYQKAIPYVDRIETINKIYDSGHVVKIHTARGMGRNNDNNILAQSEFMSLTVSQLKEWGVKYHSIMLGKPSADFYIDDKGINADEFFTTT